MARHYVKHYGDDGDPVAEAARAKEREQWAARDRQARSATEDKVYVPARGGTALDVRGAGYQ